MSDPVVSESTTMHSDAQSPVVPRHIAIIMDGNGRWAKRRNLPRIMGHRQGVQTIKRVLNACDARGVRFLTLYAFSTENWKRPRSEVSFLMQLLRSQLRKELEELRRKNVRIRSIGDSAALPSAAQHVLTEAIERTRTNTGITLVLAINYGSRQEIVHAVQQFSREVQSGVHRPEDLDEQLFGDYLYTAGIPDPDLLIRTSGEFRISNFLLWQLSYTELFITDKCWPEFSEPDLAEAIACFSRRHRRFGAL